MAGPSTSTVPTTTTHEPLLKDIQKMIQSLRDKYKHIQKVEQSQSQGKTLNQVQAELLRSKLAVLTDLEWLEKQLECLKKFSKGKTIVNGNESKERRDNGRYLCLSDGSMIICLDLEMCEKINLYRYDVQPLPKISTFKFSENGLPVSMGLFKLGSYAYLVGGNCFKSDPVLTSNKKSGFPDKKYKELCCNTYQLSLKDKKLHYSECKSIGELNSPKLWPIVEKIDDQIHVIESAPQVPHPATIPSHEVLNVKDLHQGWAELSSKYVSSYPFLLSKSFVDHTNHLVIGDRIYLGGYLSYRYEVYDSSKKTWELHQQWNYRGYPELYLINHVGQLLSSGFGRCVGRWSLDSDGKLMEPPLYVVIALGDGEREIMDAVAYLVTPTGQVLCYQRLPLFFAGFPWLFEGSKGTVINVEGEGKTMCAIVDGKLRGGQRFLHVSTFTVEELREAHTLVSDLCATRTDAYEVNKLDLPYAVEMDFVNVVVKDWYAFNLTEDDMSDCSPCVSACFL